MTDQKARDRAMRKALAQIVRGAAVADAARANGVSTSAIYYRARIDPEYGEALRGRPSADDQRAERETAFLAAVGEGVSLQEAAARANVGLSTTRYWRKFDPEHARQFAAARARGLQAKAAAAEAEARGLRETSQTAGKTDYRSSGQGYPIVRTA